MPSDAPSVVSSDVPSDAPSDVPSDVPSDSPSDAPSDTVGWWINIVQGTLDGINLIQDQLDNKLIAPRPKDVKGRGLKKAKYDVKRALKDVANKIPADADGAIKDLSKACEELKCDKNTTPPSDTKKVLCNSFADAIITISNSVRSASPLGSNVFFNPTDYLANAEIKLLEALADIKADNALIGSTLKEKEVKDAIEEVEDAQSKLQKGDFPDAIEELTKALKDLDCDTFLIVDLEREELCDAIIDAIVAVAEEMIIT